MAKPSWKCRFGLHTWTIWGKVREIWRKYEYEDSSRQVGWLCTRECTECGKPQLERFYF